MKRQIAVVTGTSSGFGLLTVLELAKRGYHVVATMRNLDKSAALQKQIVENELEDFIRIHELDVTIDRSVQGLKRRLDDLGQVDILVNNAGYAGAGFVEEIPINEYRKQFETNFFGVIAVTQVVLPFMRKQGEGKIINLSSISGRIAFPGLSPYVASKHALEGWSETLRLEVKPFGIDVVLVEPGSFQTNIWTTGKQITKQSLQTSSPYFRMMEKLDVQLKRGEARYGDPEVVAKTIVDIAQSKQPSLRYPIGKGVKATLAIKSRLPWKYWEKIILGKLKS
jgi:NAD(P)-dependent dehydrogenase (short-subunit alcohol dehydrogenase family)